jgi:hypothetical protein
MAITGDHVARAGKARNALDVHVNEVAGGRPLVAHDLVTPGSWPARHLPALEGAVDGRVGELNLCGDQAGTPAGASPQLADAVMVELGELARASPWP